MPSIRSDIWCAAFVRRHNVLGRICVLSKKGDPVAGQIWIEVDHLDKSASLFTPAPDLMRPEGGLELVFQCRFERQPIEKIRRRINQEAQFDPDFWLLTLESPAGEHGLTLVSA